MIAKEMTIKLQLIGKTCEVHDDPNIIRLKSRDIEKVSLPSLFH